MKTAIQSGRMSIGEYFVGCLALVMAGLVTLAWTVFLVWGLVQLVRWGME